MTGFRVFAMSVVTRDITMLLPGDKNTFGHGKKVENTKFALWLALKSLFAYEIFAYSEHSYLQLIKTSTCYVLCPCVDC